MRCAVHLSLIVLLLDVSIPERPKLRFVERVPLVPKVRREPKNLRDIQGPSTEATEFTEGSFAILVSRVQHQATAGWQPGTNSLSLRLFESLLSQVLLKLLPVALETDVQ